MKKIKRTITMRKVEFISPQSNQHHPDAQICPFCNSIISPQLPPTDSVVEITATESAPQLEGETSKEK